MRRNPIVSACARSASDGSDPRVARLTRSAYTGAVSDCAATDPRTGLSKPSRIEWGTHLCQLYRTQHDLVEVLVPFFAAGLAAGEECVWLTSEPLASAGAIAALGRQVPDLAARIERGQIEIVAHDEWYTRAGRLGTEEVLEAWLERERAALARGYTGLRISGNTLWLGPGDWESFTAYEASAHAAFARRRIVALCSYSLEKCRSEEIVDVLRNHAFVLIRGEDDWEVVHNATTVLSSLKQTESALELEPDDRHRLEGERSQLPWAERAECSSAEATRQHLVQLQNVTAALSEAATVADIAHVVVTQMATELGASMAILAVPTADGTSLELIDHAGLRARTTTAFATFPVASQLPVATAFRTGARVWLPTPAAIVAEYPHLSEATQRSKAIGCAPLVVGDHRLGAIGFGFATPQDFTANRRALVEDLAKQVALSLERARLYEDARRTRDRLLLLSDAAKRLAVGKLNLDEVLDALVDEVTRHLADCCAIVLRSEHANILELAALRHVDSEVETEIRETLATSPVRLGQSLAGNVAETGEARLIPIIESSMIANHEPEHREHLERHAVRSMVIVPLRASGAVIGVLTATRYQNPVPFHADDRDLLQELGDRAALAIDNARLYAREQEASRRKDEFLAVLGHELRNPLSPIVTALELMKLRGDTESTRARAVIERQVTHVRRLVDDLLDVSRITRGMVELRKERVQLTTVLDRAIEMASPLIEQRHHRLCVHFDPEPILAEVDPMRLRQVLANLLTNAARYTNPGGQIDVSCRREGDCASVSVRDTGIGIPSEAMPEIFNAFVQAQRTVESAHGGLGLGLALVKSLVELHGGKVKVQSEGPGQGSEFTITIPALEPGSRIDHANVGADDEVRPHSQGLGVLVVDDNPDAADGLADVLRALGYDAVVAYDGPQTLERARERPVEVAVLDIGLPVMDGYELGRRLQEQCGHPIRLIAMTGYGTAADRERSRAAGFEAHFTKPVDVNALLERIVVAR